MTSATAKRVCEMYAVGGKRVPLCWAMSELQSGREPNPTYWYVDTRSELAGPYPLAITCTDCLEWIHA